MGRDAFLAAGKRRFKNVAIGGEKCRIRSMTEGEWANLDLKNLDKKGQFSVANYRYSDARLIAFCVCDVNGEPVFADTDLDTIMGLDTSIVQPLIREIKSHCGLGLGVEDAEKNLNGTGNAGLPCSSAEPLPAGATA